MRLILLSLCCLLAVASCEKLVFDESLGVPVIIIGEAENVTEAGVTLVAEVHNVADQQIVESYFIWYPLGVNVFRDNPRHRAAVVISGDGRATARVEGNIAEDVQYIYQLKIVTTEGTVVSDRAWFTGRGFRQNPFRIRDTDTYFNNNTYYVFAHLGKTIAWTYHGLDEFDPNTGRFEPLEHIRNGYIGKGIFATRPDRILSAIGADNPYNQHDLWYLDNLGARFERVGNFPHHGAGIAFSFNTDDRCYYASPEWDMNSFSVDNYTGVNRHADIPFSDDARRYHHLQVGTVGYVLYSERSDTVDQVLHQNEFWSYDTEGKSWQRLPPYPGAGKEFVFFTDGDRYIYCGLGGIGDTQHTVNSQISQGDLWRYDLLRGEWELVGWAPINRTTSSGIYNRSVSERDGRFTIFYYEGRAIKILELDPRLIPER